MDSLELRLKDFLNNHTREKFLDLVKDDLALVLLAKEPSVRGYFEVGDRLRIYTNFSGEPKAFALKKIMETKKGGEELRKIFAKTFESKCSVEDFELRVTLLNLVLKSQKDLGVLLGIIEAVSKLRSFIYSSDKCPGISTDSWRESYKNPVDGLIALVTKEITETNESFEVLLNGYQRISTRPYKPSWENSLPPLILKKISACKQSFDDWNGVYNNFSGELKEIAIQKMSEILQQDP